MFVINGYEHVPREARKAVLVIGNFDGVHRGHQALLAEARRRREPGVRPCGAIVFEPHPREYFNPDKPHFRLTSLEQKLALLERFGMDIAVVLAFDTSLASMNADTFIEQVLVAGLGVAHVVVGYDFYFGKDRGGDASRLIAAGQNLGFGVTVVPPVAASGEVYSSSAIRADLAQGDVHGAAKSSVTGGRCAGRWSAAPIAAPAWVSRPPTSRLPVVRPWRMVFMRFMSIVGDRHLDGAAYLGTRPTFDDGAPVLEIFLFDFDGDLYGREIEVFFVDYIRGDQRFKSAEALMAQMQVDCDKARASLAVLKRADGHIVDP